MNPNDKPKTLKQALAELTTLEQKPVLVSDWRHLRGWGVRARFLREHLLPSPSYMRSRYPGSSAGLLPFLYVHRALAGLARLSRK